MAGLSLIDKELVEICNKSGFSSRDSGIFRENSGDKGFDNVAVVGAIINYDSDEENENLKTF